MSRKELLIAGLLLAVAIVGGASIPRLLASPAAPFGMALGPGPGRSVVQTPTVSAAHTHAASAPSSLVSGTSAGAGAPVARANVKPPAAESVAQPKQATPVTTAPPPVTTPTPPPAAAGRNPTPPVTPPGQAKTPPGQAKKLQGQEMAPPGQLKTPRGQQKTPPGHQTTPPGHLPRVSRGKPTVTRGSKDLPGSAHGRPVPQAPPHAVGHHDRGVGHLSAAPSRPAAADRHSRAKARPETRGSRGKGGHDPAAPQVTNGNGNGNGNGSGNGRGNGNGNGNGHG
jgi:hypothetical protein